MIRYLLSLFILLFFIGCSSKNTSVLLLQDNNGDVGKVVIRTKSGEQLIDKSDHMVKIVNEDKPSVPKLMNASEKSERYGGLLSSEPKAPIIFKLYFESGSNQLTTESKILVDQLINAVKERNFPEILLVGHTDKVGNADVNYQLGLKRAAVVKDMLINVGVKENYIIVDSYGENDPLILTPDEVAEPKNRRVEATVK